MDVQCLLSFKGTLKYLKNILIEIFLQLVFNNFSLNVSGNNTVIQICLDIKKAVLCFVPLFFNVKNKFDLFNFS